MTTARDTAWPGGRAIVAVALLLAMIWAIGLGAANLVLGELNQDEGWYLYAARQVAHGELPYRDFAFTQGPALPMVYAVVYAWVERWGVAGGRLFTLLLGLFSTAAAVFTAARLTPRGLRGPAAALAAVLIAGSVYQSYYTTVVKTYALCAAFLTLGMACLSRIDRTHGRWTGAWGGFWLAMAAATRISSGPALAVMGLYLLIDRKRLRPGAWIAFGFGGGLGLLAAFLPFYLVAPEGFTFGMLEYHTLRSAGGLLPALVYKAGFVSRLAQAYFLPLGLGVAWAVWRLLRRDRQAGPEADPSARMRLAMGVTLLGITLVHLSAPFPYDDYQTPLLPVYCAVLAAAWMSALHRAGSADAKAVVVRWTLIAVTLVSLASALASPINQSWMIKGRDRIWWRLKETPDLARLREVASWLREFTRPGDTLLTQDTYLAVEADLNVPRGMEMGPFSYYPDWPRERAEKLHVLNRDMMIERLETTEAPWAALSGYSLAIRSPEVEPVSDSDAARFEAVLERRYEPILEAPDFGQAYTLLRILHLRGAPDHVPAPSAP